jgi:hypothetical protein
MMRLWRRLKWNLRGRPQGHPLFTLNLIVKEAMAYLENDVLQTGKLTVRKPVNYSVKINRQ